MSQQLKDLVKTYTLLSLALDESTDICVVAQSCIFIRGINDNFSVIEELLNFESLHGKTRESDIFEKVRTCLEHLKIDSSKLVSVCSDAAPSMIRQVAGTSTLLENCLIALSENITARVTVWKNFALAACYATSCEILE